MMPHAKLGKPETERIREHVRSHTVTVAVIRTEKTPSEIESVVNDMGKACGVKPVKIMFSPTSDFGLAELNSNDRILALVLVGGDRTELVGVSGTDMAFIRDLEGAICMSNIQSGVIRNGL